MNNNLKNVRTFLLMAIEWLISCKCDTLSVYNDNSIISVNLNGLNITIKRAKK